jgi:hypothetical protein
MGFPSISALSISVQGLIDFIRRRNRIKRAEEKLPKRERSLLEMALQEEMGGRGGAKRK